MKIKQIKLLDILKKIELIANYMRKYLKILTHYQIPVLNQVM